MSAPSSTGLQRLLDALRAAFEGATADDRASRALVDEIFASLGRPREVRPRESARLPACRHLEPALARAGEWAQGAAFVRAFATLSPALAWYRRIGSEAHGEAFHDGHANAFLVGPGGLEDLAGAAVGVSLLAPHVRYPDHRHPPEELYLVLSPGFWRRGASDWFEPGVGGLVHNPPDVVHAMRADAEPLLAVWCLLERDVGRHEGSNDIRQGPRSSADSARARRTAARSG